MVRILALDFITSVNRMPRQFEIQEIPQSADRDYRFPNACGQGCQPLRSILCIVESRLVREPTGTVGSKLGAG